MEYCFFQTHPRAADDENDDDDDEDASCSSCSSSSSDNEDYPANANVARKPYGGIRASYLPNDRRALWRNSSQGQLKLLMEIFLINNHSSQNITTSIKSVCISAYINV